MAGKAGRSGGKPKPDAIKLAQGTYRADRHGDPDCKPKATGVPERPEMSDPVAVEFWHKYVPMLIEMKVAKASDAARLQSLCEIWACLRKATVAVNQDPIDKDNRIAFVEYTKQFATASEQFGLTPAARSRLFVEKETKPTIKGRKRG